MNYSIVAELKFICQAKNYLIFIDYFSIGMRIYLRSASVLTENITLKASGRKRLREVLISLL